MDLYVHSIKVDLLHGLVHYGTGIAMEIPKLHVGLAFPRSSIYKFRLSLSNSVGVIDAGYRGEVGAKFRLTILGWIKAFAYKYLHINTKSIYKVGERCCQMIILPYPSVSILEVNELSDSDRGVKGYGGSGR
jgi:dUTP pyrophosphatase